MFNNKGFTIAELLIVVLIIVVLALVAFPVYRGYSQRALESEGRKLLVEIQNAENKYYAKFGEYYDGKGIVKEFDEELGIDARDNKNFKNFKTTADNSGQEKSYTATVVGLEKANGVVLTETEKR